MSGLNTEFATPREFKEPLGLCTLFKLFLILLSLKAKSLFKLVLLESLPPFASDGRPVAE